MDINPTTLKPRMDAGRQMMNTIIVGNDRAIKLALACMIIGRGALFTGDPGNGKTALCEALQRFIIGGSSHVIENHPMIKPTQIIGQVARNPVTGEREKDPATKKLKVDLGKILTVLVTLADEINRCSEDAQNAYLGILEKGGAWIEDDFYPLPQPNAFLATRNFQTDPGVRPMIGPLLNRFAGETELRRPSREQRKGLIRNTRVHRGIYDVKPCLYPEEILAIRAYTDYMVETMPDAVLDFSVDLVSMLDTRDPYEFKKLDFNIEPPKGKTMRALRFGQRRLAAEKLKALPYTNVQELDVLARGVSTRAELWHNHVAAAMAFMDGRDKVDYADIEEAWCAQTHQLLMYPVARSYGIEPIHILTAVLDTVMK